MKTKTEAPPVGELAAALKTLELAPGENITLLPGAVCSYSLDGSAAVRVEVPSLPDPGTLVMVPRATLATALKGRKVARVDFEPDTMVISGPGYRADLRLTAAPPPPQVEELSSPAFEIDLTAELADAILKACAAVRFEKSHPALPDPIFHVKASKDKFVAVMYDAYQAAYVFVGAKSPRPFELTLPAARVPSVVRECRLSGDPFAVHLRGEGYTARMNFATSASIPPEMVLEGIQSLEATSDTWVDVAAEKISTFIDNSRAIANADAILAFEVAGGKCNLRVESSAGSVAASFKAVATSGDFEFRVDLSFMKALLSKVKADLRLVVNSPRLLFLSDQVSYLALLAADGS